MPLLGLLQIRGDCICLFFIKMAFFNCITCTRQPPASNLTRLSFNTQWWKLTMKPWETDAFSIMQGFFFFFSLKTCLPRPCLPPPGKGLNHSVKEKSYFTVFFNGYFFKLEKFHVTFKYVIKRGRARTDSNCPLSQPNLLQLKMPGWQRKLPCKDTLFWLKGTNSPDNPDGTCVIS